MKVLFCGTILPESYEMELRYLSSAANRFQWNIVKTLREQGHEVMIVSYLGFPIEDCKQEAIRQSCHKMGIDVTIKEKSLLEAIREFCRRLIKKIEKADYVWAYNVLYPWLDLGKLIARDGKKGVLVLADFSPIISYKDKLHKIYASLQEKSIRQFALVVGVSGDVKNMLKSSQKFMLMEGGVNNVQYESFEVPTYREGENLILMYSGLLSSVTGVDLLLEAFTGIENKHIELVITGKGNLEAEVRRYAQLDSRIHYCGQLVYEEYLKKLK